MRAGKARWEGEQLSLLPPEAANMVQSLGAGAADDKRPGTPAAPIPSGAAEKARGLSCEAEQLSLLAPEEADNAPLLGARCSAGPEMDGGND